MLYEPLVRVTTLPPAFLKRKPAGKLGFQGGDSPLALLCILSPRGERMWPRRGISFWWDGGLYARTYRRKGLACGPPPFFTERKEAKNRQGALPPEPPGDFVDFLSMKINSNAAT